ncbi:MAG TPA: hypothetical protein VFV38_19305 [Ktedonobacteraceae bacterium]|nr:hypothetical protein [Ktedonobacteraceae bacterium]
MLEKQPFDVEASIKRSQEGPCLLCDLVAGTNPHHLIYEDQTAVVFLTKYPSLLGYALLAPRDHREQVTGDFSLEEYLPRDAQRAKLKQLAGRLRTRCEREESVRGRGC